MALEIIGVPFSNFVRSVRMVAHERGVAYELVPEAPHSEVVKGINPFGLVPVMRHDGLEIAESMAIARYIDRIGSGPALMPEDPAAAARIDAWTAMIATSVDKILLRQYVVPYAFHRDADGNVIRTDIDKAIKRFPRVFGTLEAGVAEGFMGSASFSLPDCFILPMLAGVARFPEGEEAMAAHPALNAYFERMSERPSFVETTPPAR